jgi:hypothetical protein
MSATHKSGVITGLFGSGVRSSCLGANSAKNPPTGIRSSAAVLAQESRDLPVFVATAIVQFLLIPPQPPDNSETDVYNHSFKTNLSLIPETLC